MAKVTAIVLAAGLSKRMGEENKLFLPIQDKAMIDWVIEAIDASHVDEIILVGSESSMEQLEKWKSYRIQLVENKSYKSGMTSSIQVGVSAASGDGFMICLGDQPKIKTKTYNQLIESFSQKPDSIILPFHEGQKGNPVIFPSAFRDKILNHKEPEGCKEIVQFNTDLIVKVEVNDSGVLMDVDTREDHENLG